jgi:hypothetical protein
MHRELYKKESERYYHYILQEYRRHFRLCIEFPD